MKGRLHRLKKFRCVMAILFVPYLRTLVMNSTQSARLRDIEKLSHTLQTETSKLTVEACFAILLSR
jgi:hypothetical protein